MNILITGASGFLGGAIQSDLGHMHNLISLGRNKSESIQCDLSKDIPRIPQVDLVVHAAGKAHSIPKTEAEKKTFYKVNVHGTENLLSGLKEKPPKTIVFISSVAVYGVEFGEMIPEDHELLGNSPYAKSKIQAEKKVQDWCTANNVHAVILRLPLIAGKNPPGNLKSMAHALKSGYYFRIGNGLAKKSMVSAKSVATLIPKLLNRSGIYNLTDGVNPTMIEIENAIAKQFKVRVKVLPDLLIRFAARLGDSIPLLPINTNRYKKLTFSLTFDDSKAREGLDWKPKPALNDLTF